jgi:cobalt-zinc-cadmium efflux system outer membrane protein
LPRVVPTLPPPAPVPALAVVLDGAARGHAALVARRAAVDEAARRVAVAEREAWPVPAFGVQVAREGSAGSPANTVVLGTLGVPLPLWQQNQGETAHRRVDEAVARAEAAAAERANRVAVLAAHTALVAAAERVALWTDGIVAPLDENLAVLQRGFAAGEFALVDVTVARERFLAAERDALDAIVDYHVARADLEYAVGAPLPAAASPGVDVPAPAGVRR